MQVAALLATGLAVACLAYGVLDALFSEERRVRKRLATLDSYSSDKITEAEPLAAPFGQRVLRPTVSKVSGTVRSVTPGQYQDKLRQRVQVAGGSVRTEPDRILLAKVVGGPAAAIAIFIFAGGAKAGLLRSALLALIVGLLVVFIPDIVLHIRASNRRQQVVRELPDMLDMLTISVEAGLGFDQAVSRYIRYSRGPLGKEFGIALMEIQAGKSRREALRSMADRADVQELRTFVMAIVQADVFGVSVSDVLRTQSHEMRIKRRQRAEELAQKAPAKMAFPLVICILPATLIVVLAPAIVGLMRLFAG